MTIIKPHIRGLRCEDMSRSEMAQDHTDFNISAVETHFTNRSAFIIHSITPLPTLHSLKTTARELVKRVRLLFYLLTRCVARFE